MKTIAERIRTRAAEHIIEDIRLNGISKVFNANACIKKVKEELDIELKEKCFGVLILA